MKKILDLFVKVEDDAPKKEPEIKSAPVEKSASIPVSTTSSIGQEDVEIKKQLAAALEASNQEGYDYFEFAKSVDAQVNIIPSEALRFQSTFAVATSMGLSADKLLSSAQYYLDILKRKEDEFDTAIEQHAKKSIVAKEDSIKNLDAQMQEKAAQIQKITEEINGMQQQKTSLMNEISSAKAEIERVQNNFDATLKIFTGRISADIEKIKSYLTGGKS
jgi:chromosome segregation ATPase